MTEVLTPPMRLRGRLLRALAAVPAVGNVVGATDAVVAALGLDELPADLKTADDWSRLAVALQIRVSELEAALKNRD